MMILIKNRKDRRMEGGSFGFVLRKLFAKAHTFLRYCNFLFSLSRSKLLNPSYPPTLPVFFNEWWWYVLLRPNNKQHHLRLRRTGIYMAEFILRSPEWCGNGEGEAECLDFLLLPIIRHSVPCFEERVWIQLILLLKLKCCLVMEVRHE
jgi:hypothetical protein